MPINPLPLFEEDLKTYEDEKAAYERLKVPATIVVRFGFTMLVGEFPYKGDVVPGCGSKIVVRTHRGTEIGEMLTSTCANSGCGKSVSRKQMLEYIENSGGRDYPFLEDGKALRVATKDDMDRQAEIEHCPLSCSQGNVYRAADWPSNHQKLAWQSGRRSATRCHHHPQARHPTQPQLHRLTRKQRVFPQRRTMPNSRSKK